MKYKTNNRRNICLILTGTIIVAFVTAPTLLMAQDTDETQQTVHDRHKERVDLNGDGIIDRDERRQLRDVRNRPDQNRPDVERPDGPRREKIRDRFDRNDDGRLGPRERRAVKRFRANHKR